MTNSAHVIASAHAALAALLLGASAALAQAQPPDEAPLLANPSAIEFTVDAKAAPPPSSAYRVELFRAGDDTTTAQPVRQVDTQNATVQGGLVRIELANALRDVADGEYVARLRAVSPTGISPVSGATVPFVVYGQDGPARTATVLATQPSEAEQRKERFWTRVAVAIGAAVVVLPLLLR
jgi:hypothetical protein